MQLLHKKNKYSQTSHGFSLIELMVSLSLFAIVMVISISTLLTIIDANGKAQALYSAMTNISFALDSMSRNIRTASEHNCASDPVWTSLPTDPQDCPTGNAIAFLRQKDGARTAYRLNSGTIEQRVINASSIDSGWLPITASSTVIDTFRVSVSEADGVVDNKQTQVSLLIKGYVSNGLEANTNFTLQTTVTPRVLDIYHDVP